jgi:hypothetical protein
MSSAESNPQSAKGTINHLYQVEPELNEKGEVVAYKLLNGCRSRHSTGYEPKEITLTINQYLPFEENSGSSYSGLNLMGANTGTVTIKSGNVYSAIDGNRLVYEVGCNTIIFLLNNPKNPTKHLKYYIQHEKGFLWDAFTRNMAAQVDKATAPMVTIAKYEMYFILGALSTMSGAMAAMVFISDGVFEGSKAIVGYDAFKNLAKELTIESNKIQNAAPTLHGKLMEFMANEKENNFNAKETAKNLPKTIITDEKVQAQVAGILYGKFAFAKAAFTAKVLLITLLIQIAIKSFTKTPDSFLSPIDKRYVPLLETFKSIDWRDPNGARQAGLQFSKAMKEAGVDITPQEAEKIFNEIKQNPDQLEESLKNINKSFDKFLKRVK